jgi:hypothetical protein
MTRGQHRLHLRRKVYQQPRQLRRRLRRAQLVQVIDDQRHAAGGTGQLREDPAGQRRGIDVGCGGRRFRVAGRAGCVAHRVEHGQPEKLGVVLAWPHLDDCQPAWLARTVCPRAKQRGLPAASRSRDDRHLPGRRPIQGGNKITPVDPPGGYAIHRHACLEVPRRTATADDATLSLPGQPACCQRPVSVRGRLRAVAARGHGGLLRSGHWHRAWRKSCADACSRC